MMKAAKIMKRALTKWRREQETKWMIKMRREIQRKWRIMRARWLKWKNLWKKQKEMKKFQMIKAIKGS